jgi:uncharacterized membrane protein
VEGRINTKTALGRLLLLKLLTNKSKNKKKITNIHDEELEEVRKFIDYVIQVVRNESKRKGEPDESRRI